jgi:hypothetical protein
MALTGTLGRNISAGAALVAVLVAGTWAVAQPRNRPVHPAPKPKAGVSTTDAPNDDGSSGSASPPTGAATGSGSSAGAIPAPPADETADGGKLSPLNPAPNEFSDGGATTQAPDYDRLLADIASLRARVAAVSDTLFHSRIVIRIEATGDHARIASLGVSLDDGVVWSSPASFRPDGAVTVYEHAVAPGHHAVAIDVERRDDRDDTFRSAQRSRFIVDVPSDQRLSVDVNLSDDSNLGAQFSAEHDGRYDLRIRTRAKAEAIPR